MTETFEAPQLEFAMEVRLRFRALPKVVNMPAGGSRGMVALDSGTFEGPLLAGNAVPMSGGDFCLFRDDGVLQADARYMLQEKDGSMFMLQTRGFIWGRNAEVMQAFERVAQGQSTEVIPPEQVYFRTLTTFEAPKGKHEWLAKHCFVGMGRRTDLGNAIRYYRVL